MGRQRKVGLDYFPIDVDMFQDIKVRKLIRHQGGKAITVYALLLCYIYKSGYYLRWDKELPFIISELLGYEEVFITEVIKCCLLLGLLDKALYDSESVLTSKGIQLRYLRSCSEIRRKGVIKEYNLISSEGKKISSEEKLISSEEKLISSEEKPISSEEKLISSEEKPISSEEIISSEEMYKNVQECTIKETEKENEKERSLSPTPPYSKEKEKEKENPLPLLRACARTREESELKLHDQLQELCKDSSWKELVAMRYAIKAQDIISLFSEFELECKINEKCYHESLGDLKRHFSNWLRIKQRKDNADNNNKPNGSAGCMSASTREERTREWLEYTQARMLSDNNADEIPEALRDC